MKAVRMGHRRNNSEMISPKECLARADLQRPDRVLLKFRKLSKIDKKVITKKLSDNQGRKDK